MTVFATLLDEIDAIEGCPRTKRRVREVLARHCGERIQISDLALRARDRISTLRQLEGRSHTEKVHILVERWGVSRRTAERWVSRDA